MKRYLYRDDLHDIKRVDTDVIIVGCGAAGLYTALNLDPRLSCVLLNKAGIQHSNSMYAQGGIATVIQPNAQDDPAQHLQDTLVAGAGLCNESAVRVLVNEAWQNIEQLMQIDVPFDRSDGELLLTREGGHTRNRILHCNGDATGLHLTRRLYEAALARENIQIHDRIFLSDIVTDDNGTTGVITLDGQNWPCYFAASKVVIASGGIGRVYMNSTNAICATGDGIAAAARAGAALQDMEFVQFHPTALVQPNDNGRFFLISEALRGEGAILRNQRGEPFMQGIHPLADLAPRDIVARAMVTEMAKDGESHVYLDITARSRAFLMDRFPTIYGECLLHGLDIARDLIPVMPVQHYFMGGIQTDLDARTNITGLYACGEAACTGVHGANRLASNSLLECLVFGRRCAMQINGSDFFTPKSRGIVADNCMRDDTIDFTAYGDKIRTLTTRQCGIIRNGKDLREAYTRISEIFSRLDAIVLDTPQSIETYNQSLVASAILYAAIQRQKSVGSHFRSDEKT